MNEDTTITMKQETKDKLKTIKTNEGIETYDELMIEFIGLYKKALDQVEPAPVSKKLLLSDENYERIIQLQKKYQLKTPNEIINEMFDYIEECEKKVAKN
jgi:hypothetical protein